MGHYKGLKSRTEIHAGMWVRFNQNCRLQRNNTVNKKILKGAIGEIRDITDRWAGNRDLVLIKMLDGRKLIEARDRVERLVTELHPLEALAYQAED